MGGATAHLLEHCLLRHLDEGRAGRVAMRSGATILTYGRLAAVVARGALECRERFGAGRRVVVASRHQLHVGLGFLSLLGGGCVPLLADPGSVERVHGVARRWGAALFGETRLLEGGEGGGADIATVERWLESPAEGGRPAIPVVASRDEAFWVFTSGTTGEPKPVVHGHGAPLAACEGFASGVLGLAPDDVTISTAGLPFVYALGNNFFFPLIRGASCVLPDDLLLPTVLGQLVRHRATVLVAGPWSLEALARLARREERSAALTRLRLTLSAGEPLPARVFREWRDRFGHLPLDNLGCTETFNSFLSNAPDDAAAGTLGRPVAGYEVEVAGASPRPGARGPLRVRGESRALAVGAEDLERGSWRDASEWIETGDEVEVDGEGRLRFLGRLDHRFKVKGRFVHPSEIERRLLEVEGVRECLVVPETGPRGLTVVAVRVVSGDTEPSRLRRALLAHARTHLEPHEIPERIEVVESLPRNARGKLDRPPRRPPFTSEAAAGKPARTS